jgi:hypothetical protein
MTWKELLAPTEAMADESPSEVLIQVIWGFTAGFYDLALPEQALFSD